LTSGQVHHGEGLGLWLVYLIARRSGGTLDFPDADDAGGVVTVTLPRPSD
jgi:C4-dicarboxylate-specific signal transduction histidine kinase